MSRDDTNTVEEYIQETGNKGKKKKEPDKSKKDVDDYIHETGDKGRDA
jgi:hypothetical protein